MIRALFDFSWPVRLLIVTALAWLAISSALTSAQANVITAVHLNQGEQMSRDGGWTAPCDTRVEHCFANSEIGDQDGAKGLHHHHHADCQFGTMASDPSDLSKLYNSVRSGSPPYATVIKDITPSSADHPPKI